MLSPVNVAVLGVGSLGKEHARIYAELAAAGQVNFAGVYDVSTETARKFAEKYRVRAFASASEAAARCRRDRAGLAQMSLSRLLCVAALVAALPAVAAERRFALVVGDTWSTCSV